MKTQKTYQLFSRFYDAYTRDFNLDLPMYLELCKNKKNILEIGCGTGRVLKALVKSDRVVTGVDISNGMLEIASQKLSHELNKGILKILNFDFQEGPLPDKYAINSPCIFIRKAIK